MPDAQARFDGRRGPLAGLLLRNLLFSILTLGIYRFWGRTHVRRFVWRHTVVLDDALEYLGTGGELFIGFLIAIAVLLPVFAVYSALQFLFAVEWGPALSALEILYYLALFFLVQIAVHRMRRYRLTRTAWRGVRFGLGGSSFAYARIAFGYSLLTAATLGLAYPWLRVATLGYFARHARFGTARLSLAPSAAWLFPRWLAAGAPLAAGLGLFTALNLEPIADIGVFLEHGDDAIVERAVLDLAFWPLLLLPVAVIFWMRYGVVEFRHMIDSLRIGDAGFSSSFRTAFFFRRIGIFLVILIGGFGVLAIASFVHLVVFGLLMGDEEPSGLYVILMVLVPFIPVLLFSGIFKILFLDIPLLAHACATLGISNAAALDEVVQASGSLPAYGEGAAEALDVGGF